MLKRSESPERSSGKIHYRKLTKEERGGKRYKYELTRGYILRNIDLGDKNISINKYVYYVARLKLLFIRKGYRWDGSTVVFDTEYCMRASLVHDVLCQLINEGLLDRKKYQDYADQIYRDIIIEDGTEIIEKGPKWLRWPRLKILWGWASIRYTGLRINAMFDSFFKKGK